MKLKGLKSVDVALIAYAEGSGSYTTLHFVDGKKKMFTGNLMLVTQMFSLMRVHKKYSINVAKIEDVDRSKRTIHLGRHNCCIYARRNEFKKSPLMTGYNPTRFEERVVDEFLSVEN